MKECPIQSDMRDEVVLLLARFIAGSSNKSESFEFIEEVIRTFKEKVAAGRM